MKVGKKHLIVVGDRVLIELEDPSDRTAVGLYLPQTVVEKEKVASGRVVAIGPGTPVPDLDRDEDEFWRGKTHGPHYVPMQAQVGDYALFLKKASVDIKFEGREYVIVPHPALLALVREQDPSQL